MTSMFKIGDRVVLGQIGDDTSEGKRNLSGHFGLIHKAGYVASNTRAFSEVRIDGTGEIYSFWDDDIHLAAEPLPTEAGAEEYEHALECQDAMENL